MTAAEAAVFPDLDGKVAVITGGSKGIGRATARLLARNGSKVAVVARSQPGVDETVAELRELGADALGLLADVSDPGALATVHRDVAAALGPVDLVLPYAGGFESFSGVLDTTLEEWETVLRGNLTATFLALREFLPAMTERRSGAFVLMSSISARVLDKLTTASYAAAKAGVLMLMRHAAIEVGEFGVRINAIAPGTIATERVERIMDEPAMERTAALSPLGRLGTPEDCAAASAFLASEASGWMTGVTIDVSGGRVML